MTVAAIEKYTLHDVPAPKVIASDAQHEQYVAMLLGLERRKHLTHEERAYAELLTVLIETYEEEHHEIRPATPTQVLHELMDANDLRQKDLAAILGGESVVSEIVNGKRPLSKNHIEKLSKRFNVSPEVFF